MKLLAYSIALLAAALPLSAQQAEPGPLVMRAENRTAAAEAAAGQPRADESVQRDDVVRYTLVFTNPSDAEIRGIVLENPLPSGMRIDPTSALLQGAEGVIEYSIDGGRSYAVAPIEELVVEGRRVERPAPPERFTHVRFRIDGWVGPRAVVTAWYDVRLGGATSARRSGPDSGGARR